TDDERAKAKAHGDDQGQGAGHHVSTLPVAPHRGKLSALTGRRPKLRGSREAARAGSGATHSKGRSSTRDIALTKPLRASSTRRVLGCVRARPRATVVDAA